jgi:hypothetical protein
MMSFYDYIRNFIYRVIRIMRVTVDEAISILVSVLYGYLIIHIDSLFDPFLDL